MIFSTHIFIFRGFCQVELLDFFKFFLYFSLNNRTFFCYNFRFKSVILSKNGLIYSMVFVHKMLFILPCKKNGQRYTVYGKVGITNVILFIYKLYVLSDHRFSPVFSQTEQVYIRIKKKIQNLLNHSWPARINVRLRFLLSSHKISTIK